MNPARSPAYRLIDLHFDLPFALFLGRDRPGLLTTQFLPEFEAGHIGLLGVALYVEDKYLPGDALRVARDELALLQDEIAANPKLKLCRTFAEIVEAEAVGRIALLLTMEGVEPLGDDLDLLRDFHERGLRALSLTHARVNAAAAGAVFAARGSPTTGLTSFGRELVDECERLGIVLDLAHINPAGFEEICARTKKPLIVSHSNVRRFYDIERNLSDEQIRMIGAGGGVVGINAIFVSPTQAGATLDRYVDHLEHVADLIGIEGVAIGFDFCAALFDLLPQTERVEMAARTTAVHFVPELRNHADAPNLLRKLRERGFGEEETEKFLRGNWLRILRQLL